jgi:transposase-like protein
MTIYEERCPRCGGKGTVVKYGPHDDEYDSRYPCPRCTKDRTALKGTGWVVMAKMDPRP